MVYFFPTLLSPLMVELFTIYSCWVGNVCVYLYSCFHVHTFSSLLHCIQVVCNVKILICNGNFVCYCSRIFTQQVRAFKCILFGKSVGLDCNLFICECCSCIQKTLESILSSLLHNRFPISLSPSTVHIPQNLHQFMACNQNLVFTLDFKSLYSQLYLHIQCNFQCIYNEQTIFSMHFRNFYRISWLLLWVFSVRLFIHLDRSLSLSLFHALRLLLMSCSVVCYHLFGWRSLETFTFVATLSLPANSHSFSRLWHSKWNCILCFCVCVSLFLIFLFIYAMQVTKLAVWKHNDNCHHFDFLRQTLMFPMKKGKQCKPNQTKPNDTSITFQSDDRVQELFRITYSFAGKSALILLCCAIFAPPYSTHSSATSFFRFSLS